MIQAEAAKIYEVQQFIKYIRTDIDAFKHALSYSWSNGIVEGQVNRFKVLKRQMYGRANLDLLSNKVLYQLFSYIYNGYPSCIYCFYK